MNNLDGKEKILQSIKTIDTQLEENKKIVDTYQGCTVDDVGEEMWNKLLRLCDHSVKLMVIRARIVKYLQNEYGITLM